jgi:diguanylate cyclase (GGDEF)-like protein
VKRSAARAIFYFLLFPLIFPPIPAAAALDADGPAMVYGFKAYGLEQGLTNPSITAITQDLDGFLWVGTEDGLFRLEGERFRHFGMEDGLPADAVVSLSFALPRGIWVITDKGIAWWDGRQFRRPSTFGFPHLNDCSGLPIPSGGVILSNFEAEQRFFSPTDGNGFLELKGLPWGGGAQCAFHDPKRRLLAIALQEGLWIWDGMKWKSRPLFDAAEPNKTVLSLLIDEKGRTWLRQVNRLFRLETFDAPLVEVPAPEPLSLVSQSYLAEDVFGRIWTNSGHSLIWFSDSGSGVLGERQGLPPGGAFVFHVDRQGTLWAGGDAVFKLQGDFLWTSAARREGLPGDVTWSVCRTRDGRIWAGTSGGLAYGIPGGWRIVRGTELCQIMALYEDAEGALWAGHEPGGVFPSGVMRVPPGGTDARAVFFDDPKLQGTVYSIARGPENSFFFVVPYMGFIRARLNPSGKLNVERMEIPGWKAEDSLMVASADMSGGVWLGGEGGVAHWNGDSWAVLPKGMLSDEGIISILPLGLDDAWIAPQNSRQLARVERSGSVLRVAEQLPRTHPLSRTMIYGLGRDEKGVIWVATARGLLRWEKGRVEKYGRNAGFPGEDCAQNALFVEPGGDVWAGISVGLVHGAMSLRRDSQTPPEVVILEVLDGQGRIMEARAPAPTVAWSDNTMVFRYAARGSKWTEEVEFQVRLVGLEDAWRTTDISEARFPNLAAGNYRFEVRSLSVTGENGPTKSIAFRIIAPWWRRWWAQLLWAILAIGIVFLGFRRRTVILRRRNEFLESLVQARTSELEHANEALREAVLIDPLTGLYNRRYLTMTMPEEEIRLRRMFRSYLQRGESPLNRNEDLVLFLGDLDFFKQINDTYGHTAGDQVIMETAQVLRAASRTADTLVRWGGEEFLLVAKRTEREKAFMIAEKLCQAVRDHICNLPDGRMVRCTISIGFAVFPILEQNPEAFTWEDTLQVADQCLYAVKIAGRDGWVGIHTPEALASPELISRMRTDLKGLVREGHVKVRTSFPEGKVFGGPGK